VPRLHELWTVVCALPRCQQTVDAVARVTENLTDAPLSQPVE
jgi:hypothetical protein